MRTSPAPTDGSGRSWTCSTSGPPCLVMTTARIDRRLYAKLTVAWNRSGSSRVLGRLMVDVSGGSPWPAPRSTPGTATAATPDVRRVLEGADATGWPVAEERGPDDPGLRYRPPVAAVVGDPAVVAHQVVVAARDGDRPREGAKRRVGARLDIGAGLLDAVAVHVAVADPQRVAGQADDALDEGLAGDSRGVFVARPGVPRALRRIAALGAECAVRPRGRVKDHDVSHIGMRAEPVDQNPLPFLKRRDHGRAGDPVWLD